MNGRINAKRQCRKLNDTIGDLENIGGTKLAQKRAEILDDLLGSFDPKAIEIEPPFFCDYGYNIHVGTGFYCNHNCVILGTLTSYYFDRDCAKVTIGDRVVMGPNVQIYSATHPIEIAPRRAGVELAYPITVAPHTLTPVTRRSGMIVG